MKTKINFDGSFTALIPVSEYIELFESSIADLYIDQPTMICDGKANSILLKPGHLFVAKSKSGQVNFPHIYDGKPGSFSSIINAILVNKNKDPISIYDSKGIELINANNAPAIVEKKPTRHISIELVISFIANQLNRNSAWKNKYTVLNGVILPHNGFINQDRKEFYQHLADCLDIDKLGIPLSFRNNPKNKITDSEQFIQIEEFFKLSLTPLHTQLNQLFDGDRWGVYKINIKFDYCLIERTDFRILHWNNLELAGSE